MRSRRADPAAATPVEPPTEPPAAPSGVGSAGTGTGTSSAGRLLAAGAVVAVAMSTGLASSVVLVDPSCDGPAGSWRCGPWVALPAAGLLLVLVAATALALRACRVVHPVAVAILALTSVGGVLVAAGGGLPGFPLLPVVLGAAWAWAFGPRSGRWAPWALGGGLLFVMAAGLLDGG